MTGVCDSVSGKEKNWEFGNQMTGVCDSVSGKKRIGVWESNDGGMGFLLWKKKWEFGNQITGVCDSVSGKKN